MRIWLNAWLISFSQDGLPQRAYPSFKAATPFSGTVASLVMVDADLWISFSFTDSREFSEGPGCPPGLPYPLSR